MPSGRANAPLDRADIARARGNMGTGTCSWQTVSCLMRMGMEAMSEARARTPQIPIPIRRDADQPLGDGRDQIPRERLARRSAPTAPTNADRQGVAQPPLHARAPPIPPMRDQSQRRDGGEMIRPAQARAPSPRSGPPKVRSLPPVCFPSRFHALSFPRWTRRASMPNHRALRTSLADALRGRHVKT